MYLVFSTLLYEREREEERGFFFFLFFSFFSFFFFFFVLDTRQDSLYKVTSYLPQLRKG